MRCAMFGFCSIKAVLESLAKMWRALGQADRVCRLVGRKLQQLAVGRALCKVGFCKGHVKGRPSSCSTNELESARDVHRAGS